MRAALRNGPKKVQCIEVDKPTPLDNEVLISVKSFCICGSDTLVTGFSLIGLGVSLGTFTL